MNDPKGRPILPGAIVDVRIFGTWERGVVLRLLKKNILVRVAGREHKRPPEWVFVVPSSDAPRT